IFTVGSLAAFALWGSAADNASEEEVKSLAGEWSAEYHPPIPSGLAPKLPEGNPSVWSNINADGTAKNHGVDKKATVTFNHGNTPKTVDIEYSGGPLKGKKQFGIYEFKKGKKKELDTWVLVVADLDTKEADRPKDLEAKKPRTTRYTFGRSYTRVIE